MWIITHTFDDAGERRQTLINTDHIARVRCRTDGKAVILWAIANRSPLPLDEPYLDFIARVGR